jgi:soluble lytic murein transglycosylase-like protein
MLLPLLQINVMRRPPRVISAPRWQSVKEIFSAQLAALRASHAPTAHPATRSASATPAATPLQRDRGRSGPAQVDAWLGTQRQRALASAIVRASERAGVAPDLSLAVAVAESSLDPSARSADGRSSGTFQVTAPTAAAVRDRFARRELVRPPGSDDVALGVAHLRYLHDLFDRQASLGGNVRTVAVGDPRERSRFAVAAYNAGEGRVARAQEQAAALRRDPTRFASIRAFLPRITQRYVDRVMRYSGRAPTRTIAV